jgi:hypothetical protein
MTGRSLQEFFDTLRSAQQANRANFPEWYDILEWIDRCFVRVGENLINPKPVLTANLLLRCQYAFKTAAGMALAGQVVETFVMQRSVLEYAGYCLVIFEDPSLEGVFLLRHANAETMETHKDKFTIGAAKRAVRRRDGKLADIFLEDYERSINFGGHPNPHAALSAMLPDEREGLNRSTVYAISPEPKVVVHALKCAAQVGLTALCVLQHAFKEKFELLGIREEIDALKNTGML